MTADPYSRAISFLKVVLPLVALALLSTMFLLSNKIEPGKKIPFAERDMIERVQNQQLTEPVYTTVTETGDHIRFTARDVVTNENGTNSATDANMRITYPSGEIITATSLVAHMDQGRNLLELHGDVVIRRSDDLTLETSQLFSKTKEVSIHAPHHVFGYGDFGTLNAGSMQVQGTEHSQKPRLFFTNGVKLIYMP